MNSAAKVAVFGLVALGACGGGMMTSNDMNQPLPTLSDVSEAQWNALAARPIFFGHQSVGGNIMQGVADVLATNPHIKLTVVESREAAGKTPAFRHALVGRNDYPLEKFDDFLALASSGFGPAGGVAMLKLCYVDIHTHTNADTLFAQYQRRIAELQARNPSVTVVHFTAPLTSIENWKGRLRAAITNASTSRERNAVRERYNQLMRQAYLGKAPLFDLARLEST